MRIMHKSTKRSAEESGRGDSHEGPCDASSPTFWLDMCSNIATNVSEYVNLQLNPERWTGYNGSHVWDAIYQENCFVQTATDVEQVSVSSGVLLSSSSASASPIPSTYPCTWTSARSTRIAFVRSERVSQA
jgi:hypothetical protein